MAPSHVSLMHNILDGIELAHHSSYQPKSLGS